MKLLAPCLLGALVLAAAAPVPCLWDWDTLRAEAAGQPDVLAVISGRFDRLPDAYYERRIELAEAGIREDPGRLELYDNLGVACDRLGRGDEAIAWMVAKDRQLNGSLDTAGQAGMPSHRYRYLANLGTFEVHRWLRNGADLGDLGGVERARECIAAAIETNAEAHFGRERYQLLALDWILSLPDREQDQPAGLFPDQVEGWSGIAGQDKLVAAGWDDAVAGLSGLIELGAGWESVDLFEALEDALVDGGDASLGYCAHLRVLELLQAGALPLRGDRKHEVTAVSFVPSARHGGLEAYFTEARSEADGWRQARNAYVLERIGRGEHPDSHAGFWAEWSEPTHPPTPPDPMHGYTRDWRIFGTAALCLFLLGAWLSWRVFRWLRSRSRRGLMLEA